MICFRVIFSNLFITPLLDAYSRKLIPFKETGTKNVCIYNNCMIPEYLKCERQDVTFYCNNCSVMLYLWFKLDRQNTLLHCALARARVEKYSRVAIHHGGRR